MSRFGCFLTLSVFVPLSFAQVTNSQIATGGLAAPAKIRGQVVRAPSSIEKPEDIGVRAHTNLRMFVPSGGQPLVTTERPEVGPPVLGLFYETPASAACIYHLVTPTPGCNPDIVTLNPTGGSGAIAIVDAFHDPTVQADVNKFSKQFGLAHTKIDVVYAQGTQPPADPTGGWELEESLDVEWAHAMAPSAKIYLVEAADNSFGNLFEAVVVASTLVASNGGGEVSMSWGGAEFADEVTFDDFFAFSGIVYVAAAGDGNGTIYPSVSPNVISAGGTTVSRDPFAGNFILENTWQDAGGGPSLYEPRPPFQDAISSIVGLSRATPDLSFDSNPNTGVWVYDGNSLAGFPPGPHWYIVGGTSVATPSLAGIINTAGGFQPSSQAENTLLYQNLRTSAFRDITYGNCYFNQGFFAAAGWDFCTGVGTPLTLKGK